MADKITISDYLENATESSKRVRFTTIVLVVVTVLILAGLLNSIHNHSWILKRIEFRQEYGYRLEKEIDKMSNELKDPAASKNFQIVTCSPVNENADTSNSLQNICLKPVENDSVAAKTPEAAPPVGAENHSESDEEIKKPVLVILSDKIKKPFQKEEDIFKARPPSCGFSICENQNDKEKLACYKCSKEFSDGLLQGLLKSYVDNVYLVKVPFFGVAFDINDLGFLGGIALLTVLILLRLSLRNYIVNLRIIKKAFISERPLKKAELEKLYEILATRQLFVFPQLSDSGQQSYAGETEKIWNASSFKEYLDLLKDYSNEIYSDGFKRILKALSKIIFMPVNIKVIDELLKSFVFLMLNFLTAALLLLGLLLLGPFAFLLNKFVQILLNVYLYIKEFFSKSASDDQTATTAEPDTDSQTQQWVVNPQSWLRRTPKIISLVPTVVYFLVVCNDYYSLQVGTVVDHERAVFGFFSSIFFLLLIFLFSCWCISKWYEIDYLWKKFHKDIFK